MKLQILSKKTKGGLFVQFEIQSPGETEIDGLAMEPPGQIYGKLLRMEEELRGSGEICDSPDTGFQERVEPLSDASFITSGYFEVRDEPASEALIARLQEIFPEAEADVEYL